MSECSKRDVSFELKKVKVTALSISSEKKALVMGCRHYIKRSGQLDEYFTVLYQQQASQCTPARALTFKNSSVCFTDSIEFFFLSRDKRIF